MPRSRLGPLAIESKLGDDPAKSSVWRAVHVQQKKAIAVKVFSAPFGGTPEARQAFSAEWERLKLIQHPGIARCFGGGFEDADAYLAYELIEGETFASQLNRVGRVSWENALEVAQGLIESLEFLHRDGLTHGAIGPDKVVITGFSPVLVDMRIERLNSPFRTTRPPSVSEVARQAPEIVAAGANPADFYTPASDLYSFGAMLYQAITGRLPIGGTTVEEIRARSAEIPQPPASVVLECPVWFDKLIMQLLDKNPAHRPVSATAVKMALAEVRKRAMSRAGVAEHVSSGFSPLQVTGQQDKDEARKLLGRGVVDLDKSEKQEREEIPDATVWHDQPWLLIGGLVLLLAVIGFAAWPQGEASLRAEAERLIAQDTRSALAQAERDPLRQLVNRFPDGDNGAWAQEQIDRINVIQFLHQLEVKIKKNLPIKREGELLHKQAQQYVQDGDVEKAIEKYQSIVTVLEDDDEFKTVVNAARYQINLLELEMAGDNDAARIVRQELQEADELLVDGRTDDAKKIWRRLIVLHDDNPGLRPLIDQARERLGVAVSENASETSD